MNRKQFIAATLGALAAPFVIKEQAVERTPEVKNTSTKNNNHGNESSQKQPLLYLFKSEDIEMTFSGDTITAISIKNSK